MAKKAKGKRKTSASRRKAGTKVPLHVVVHFVRMLHDRKRAAKFIAHAKKSGASITIPPKGVKAIDSFLKEHNLQSVRTARGIDVCPNPNDPWDCPRPS
jgi:hypothetical protein